MHGFKSGIWAEWKNSQNGTFEPVHEIQKNVERFEQSDVFFKSKQPQCNTTNAISIKLIGKKKLVQFS